MVTKGNIIRFAAALAVACLALTSCHKNRMDSDKEFDKVMILYSAGYNSLSEYLRSDIEEVQKGFLPSRKGKNALLLISKLTTRGSDYSTKTSPCLIRITGKNVKGEFTAQMDTLLSLENGAVLADINNTRTMLEYISEHFHSKSYGMVVSSHGTGWLPNGYFTDPDKYEGGGILFRRSDRESPEGLPVYVERYHDPSLPPVKTVGQEVETIKGKQYSHEMEIEEFAKAIPFHLDYLLFDVCLMGGIEVAYAMKDVTDVIGFSQTEVLADGFDYKKIAHHLLAGAKPDPKSVCSDYFESYDEREGRSRSASISLVDCTKLEPLAQVCRSLFAKYGDIIRTMDGSRVQAYFYDRDYHWHYDLYDIIAKAGASYEELSTLSEALSGCVLYKAATPSFFHLELKILSGFSMYLPSDGSKYLDDFYRTLGWNKATGLVSE